MEPIRVIELFAGIGAQHQALKQANIPHDVVAISEIDPGAVRAYEAIHGKVNNLGDITKVEHLMPTIRHPRYAQRRNCTDRQGTPSSWMFSLRYSTAYTTGSIRP